MSNVSRYCKKKSHGQVLCEIAEYFGKYLLVNPAIVVRERSFSKYHRETQTLNKVVGVTDMLLWSAKQTSFVELTPAEIKKIITGKGSAEKEEVARGLAVYIGEQEYTCDDESDAAAVAIAFLLREGYILPADVQEEGEH